ncbi:MAG: glycosyltransferase family 2 protein [Patescibacteria group bacterium]|jgi:dolichol-phosphate mannosyltransferase
MKKAVVVLPTYNEAGNIEKMLESLNKIIRTVHNWDIQIMVVDDSSPDGTGKIVKKLMGGTKNLHLIIGKKQGLGKAYVNGFRNALEKLNPFVLFEMDADLSHDPLLIPVMLKKIEEGADFVIGSRYMKGGGIPANWGLNRKIYSITANLFIRFGFMNLKVHDWSSGYRAIRAWVVKDMLTDLEKYNGYIFQIALLDKAIKKNAIIEEVPLKFVDREKGVSKINAREFITNIFGYLLQNSGFVKFVIVGFIGFGIDFSIAYVLIKFITDNKPLANGISSEFAIICNFFLNNFWSFRHKQITGGLTAFVPKLLLFNIVSSGNILIQAVGMYVALLLLGDTVLLGVPTWIIYKIGIIAFLIIPYSYFMYNKIIWKKK